MWNATSSLFTLIKNCLMCPQLLSKPKFSGVEKIKTIGSTYMAATGLNVTPGPDCAQVVPSLGFWGVFVLSETLFIPYLDSKSIRSHRIWFEQLHR